LCASRYGSASEDESDDDTHGGSGLFGLVAYADEDAEERRRSLGAESDKGSREAADMRSLQEEQGSVTTPPLGGGPRVPFTSSSNGGAHTDGEERSGSGAQQGDGDGAGAAVEDDLLPPRPVGASRECALRPLPKITLHLSHSADHTALRGLMVVGSASRALTICDAARLFFIAACRNVRAHWPSRCT